MMDDRDLFDYWHDKVRFRNKRLMEAPGHVQTHELRHECTNYDDLRSSREVQTLQEPERSKVIAIIKYECTAKVLQHRAGRLRDRAHDLEQACQELDHKQSRLLNLVKALQEKLFGKDKEIAKLEARVAGLEAENEALRLESEDAKAHAELLAEFEQLKQQFAAVEKRKQELAKNNQSLGGRVAHTQRFRRERDEARTLAEQQKQQIKILTEQNQHLREENEKLRLILEQLQHGKQEL